MNRCKSLFMQAYERQREEMEKSGVTSLTADLAWYVSGKIRALFGDTADTFIRFACSPARYSRLLAGPDKPGRLIGRMKGKDIVLSDRAASRAYFTVEGSEYTEAAKFAASGGFFSETAARILKESSRAAQSTEVDAMRRRSSSAFGDSPKKRKTRLAGEVTVEPHTDSCCTAECARWKERTNLCLSSCGSSWAKCCTSCRSHPGRACGAACSLVAGRFMLFLNNRQHVHTFKQASDMLRIFAHCTPEEAKAKEALFNSLHIETNVGRAQALKLQAAIAQLLSSKADFSHAHQATLKQAGKLLGVESDSESDADSDSEFDARLAAADSPAGGAAFSEMGDAAANPLQTAPSSAAAVDVASITLSEGTAAAAEEQQEEIQTVSQEQQIETEAATSEPSTEMGEAAANTAELRKQVTVTGRDAE